MARKPRKPRTPPRPRWHTALQIAALVGAALAVGAFASSWERKNTAQHQAISRYIEANRCTVAYMNGKMVQSYRCDLPAPGAYITASNLNQRAIAEAHLQ